MEEDADAAAARRAALVEALVASAIVTALVGGEALLVPKRHVATVVGFTFLAAVWALVWRRDDDRVRRAGLGFAGLLLKERIDARRVARATGRAVLGAVVLGLVLFVPYYFAWRLWWRPQHPFYLFVHPLETTNEILGQVLLIALPEEAFYRGYLQSRLDEALPPRTRVLGATVGPGLLISSVIFAVGHLVTIPSPARLAVFFPALVFGWLRARTGGVGTGVAFHALCNLFSEALGRGFAVY